MFLKVFFSADFWGPAEFPLFCMLATSTSQLAVLTLPQGGTSGLHRSPSLGVMFLEGEALTFLLLPWRLKLRAGSAPWPLLPFPWALPLKCLRRSAKALPIFFSLCAEARTSISSNNFQEVFLWDGVLWSGERDKCFYTVHFWKRWRSQLRANQWPRHEILGFGSHRYCLPVVLLIAHSNDHLAEGWEF